MNIRHVLVPVDYSHCSMDVTRRASALAAQLGARITLLHVAELPPGVFVDTPVHPEAKEVPAGEVLRRDAEAHLAPFITEVRAAGVEGIALIRLGAVVPSILSVVDELGADLIVIGTHGRRGLARILLGSVAESVAREAHVPVMLVRREPGAGCGRADCAWCGVEGRSPVEDRIAAETDG